MRRPGVKSGQSDAGPVPRRHSLLAVLTKPQGMERELMVRYSASTNDAFAIIFAVIRFAFTAPYVLAQRGVVGVGLRLTSACVASAPRSNSDRANRGVRLTAPSSVHLDHRTDEHRPTRRVYRHSNTLPQVRSVSQSYGTLTKHSTSADPG